MSPVAWRIARFLLVVSMLCLGVDTAFSETLREVLAAKNLPIAGAKLANLDKNITSGAQLDDANQFLIAYYVDDGTGVLKPPIFIDRFDWKHEEWKSAALAEAQARWEDVDVPCVGSIMSITSIGNRLLLDTHINPSAGCTLILSQDMKMEASLYGWPVGRLGADALIYHRSQIHFAPVHPAEIALYDLRTKREITLFPTKPASPIWRARTLQLQGFYKENAEWCNKNNDPCDPEYFDSSLGGAVAANEKEQALAFVISYEQIQMVQGEVQKPSGPKEVLYVYREVGDEAKMEYREMLSEDAKARFGDVPLQSLLQPEVLRKIFSEAPPKRP